MSRMKKHIEDSAMNCTIIALMDLKGVNIRRFGQLISLEESTALKEQCERVISEINRHLGETGEKERRA